jgi:two-component system cell cycle response regulator DivK
VEEHPPRAHAYPLVLLVDDDADTREMYTAALSFLGCFAIAASDAASAYARACHRLPDIIVTDVVMPDGDGWSLMRDLKADPRTSAIPVVVLTGYAGINVPARARAEGCAAFLLKPCLPEHLLGELTRVISRMRPSAAPS